MLRRSHWAAALLASVLPAAQAAAESSTIRIEPRPYHGAIVSIEQGVRVWRPLPPTRHMIINPTGSPVHLSVADVRETVTHNAPVYPAGVGPAGGQAQPSQASPTYYYGRPFYRHVPRRHPGVGPRRH